MEDADVTQALAELSEGIATFKKTHGGRVTDLDARLKQLECRMERPGGFSTESKSEPAVAPATWETPDGRPVPLLSKGQSLEGFLWAKRREAGKTEEEAGFQLGRALQAMVRNNWSGAEAERKSLAGTSGPAGGYLLPTPVAGYLVDLARNRSVVFQAGAMVLPMETKALTVVRVTADPTMGWYAENATIAPSDPTFGALNMLACKGAALIKVSRELVNDGVNTGPILEHVLSQAMAVEIDRAALLGAGGSEPAGLFSTSGVNELGSIGAISYDDFLSAIEAVETDNGEAQTAVFTPACKSALAQLKESTTNAYLRPPDDFTALQRLVTNQLADSQAVVGDFRQMIIGIRQELEIFVSRDAGVTADQIVILCSWRGDVAIGRPDSFCTMEGITYA